MRTTPESKPARRVAVLVIALAGAPAAAVTVHTWVDADGVRHYADQPPADDATGASAIELDVGGASAPADDYFSVLNQWRRLREERENAEKLALERERVAATQAPPPPPVYLEVPDRSVGLYGYPGWPVPGYGYGYGYGGKPRHQRHRDGHGRERPVLHGDHDRASDPFKPRTWPRER
jgi:hypothetical protein